MSAFGVRHDINNAVHHRDPIEIVLTKIQGQQARIGIAAPKSGNIVRSEIDEKDTELR